MYWRLLRILLLTSCLLALNPAADRSCVGFANGDPDEVIERPENRCPEDAGPKSDTGTQNDDGGCDGAGDPDEVIEAGVPFAPDTGTAAVAGFRGWIVTFWTMLRTVSSALF